MRIINIDNHHLLTHRYGWYKIMQELVNTVESDICLVDFMDKYFNLWFEQPINIVCKNDIIYNKADEQCENFCFHIKDAYYHINDIGKNDVFIYEDRLNIYHMIKWYPEYNEFKLMKGEVMQHFKKKIICDNMSKPWIGIVHYPEFVKDMNYESYESLPNILMSSSFIESSKYCKCIITLSIFLKEYLEDLLVKNNLNIPVKVLYHPTDFSCKTFNLRSFTMNKEKKIIQIGFWMRKMNTIYNILTNKYVKYWLPGGQYWKEMFIKMYDNHQEYLNDNSVIIKMYLSNEEYDKLLSKNIALIDVFNSSANNTVLECISRNTPLITTYHPAIVEYLGIDYPLYFKSSSELNDLINSDDFIGKVKDAHRYLKNMNKDKFKIKYFCDSFKNILKDISL